MEKKPLFTVDWEDWNHALHIAGESRVEEPTRFILQLLNKYEIKAIFYVLERCYLENNTAYNMILDEGHWIGDHGSFHDHGEFKEGDYFRSPYWDTTPMPFPPSGGFFFRFMPFWYVKWAVKKSGVLWVHPHDVDENHPKIKNPILNWKRHVGLKNARKKLERLIKEIDWDEPGRTH